MKKIICFAVCFMVVLFSFPSIGAKAASTDDIYFKTNESVDGFFEDTTYNSIQRHITGADPSTVTSYYSYLPITEYQAANSVESFDLSEWDFYLFYQVPSDTSSLYLYVCKYASEVHTMIATLNQNTDFNNENYSSGLNFRVFAPNVQTTRLNLQYTNGAWRLASNLVINNLDGFLAWDMPSCNLLASNGYCMARYDVVNVHGYNYYLQIGYDHYEEFTNFISPDLPYTNSSGNTADPNVVVESNTNHMYFNSCDFGFCEPKGISNYNQFGGAYIYCRYVVDDWVVNHISDYSLQISMETLLDNQRYFRTLNYPLDRDGCLTLPFKNFGLTGRDDVTQGFVVVGNTNQTIDSDYYKVNLYSITTEQSKAEWFENAARTYNSVKAIDIYDTYDFSDVQDFYESNVAKYNKFTINLRAVLVSGNDNSGPVARSFNLVTGSDIATDTSGYDNQNPFVPDDSTEDYTPSLPSENNTTVPSIVINTGGTWQGTLNGKIGFDPGYTDLKLDINKDPDGNFTQYLNPMKNQSFGSWFFSFLDDMPGEMKGLLIAGTGVGIFFGIYRFIRRG